jgi:hypothetical protein
MTDIDFDAVIAELRSKGWHKGGMYGEDGSACLIGAIDRVLARQMGRHSSALACFQAASETVLPVIREQFPDRLEPYRNSPTNGAARFNDHRETTLDDVILVCEKARAAQGEIR